MWMVSLVLWLMVNQGLGPHFVGTGTVEYRATHPLHVVVGTSYDLRVVADESRRGLAMTARVPVASFRSGNVERDARISDAMDAQHHPLITLHAELPRSQLPDSGQVARVAVQAQVEAHGVTVAHPIELFLDFVDPEQPTATFELHESLKAHHIQPPRILLMRVRDNLLITGRVQLRRLPSR
jgi:hypothetical protein